MRKADKSQIPAHPAINFPTEGHEIVASLETSSFWFRARNRLIVDLLRRYAPNFASLIDVGCGTGFVLQGIRAAFPLARLAGSEPLATGLCIAQERVGADVDLLHADIARLPYVDEFDVVGAFDVLEHIEDDRLALASLARVARPGGVLLLTVPQHPWLWSATDDIAQHCRRYRRGELETKVAAAGLDVLMTTSFVCSLMPAMLVNRLFGAVGPGNEHKLPHAVDAWFDRVLDVERRLIGGRIRLPLGGTRVVVARRVRE